MMPPSKEQFQGCLIGQCVGDALGFPVEGVPTHHCQSYVQNIMNTQKIFEICIPPFELGQYTDDSQLAREFLQSYFTRGCFDPKNYAQRIADIFMESRIVGRGRATTQAALRIADGVPWDKAGTPAPSAGNGSAMRAAPVGLLFFDDPQQLIDVACKQGMITHRDPRCNAGSVVIAGATALAMSSDPLNPQDFLGQLEQWAGQVEATMAAGVAQLGEWLALPPEQALAPISRCGIDPDFEDGWVGISPFVIPSVLWSVYSFLRTPDDYWQTISTAIAAGGDVDTTAAMAGAISGAHLGLGAIPPRFARRVTDRGTWGYLQLLELAEKCFNIKFAGK